MDRLAGGRGRGARGGRLSRRWWAALAAVCAAGLLLRAGVAVLDARRPLFPPHYYNDERDYVAFAATVNAGRLRGARLTTLTPGKELYTQWLALLARTFGPGPLPGRLANAAAGAAAAGLWGWTAAALAGPAAGLAAAAFLALWPSNVFHTSLAIKESPIALLLAACAAALAAGWSAQGRRRQACFAAAAAAALAAGFLRSYLLPLLVPAAVAAAGRAGAGRRLAALSASLWLAGALGAYRPLKRALADSLAADSRVQAFQLVPTLKDDAADPEVPLRASLAGLAAYRRSLFAGTRRWSLMHSGRAPESVLFPDQRLDTWLDFALFLPKACFYELFMPLPGLYPTEGKPGRVLAAAEGVVLLLVFAAACRGLVRLPWTPQAAFLAAFFCLAVPPTAFLEFDLGSASRHRVHFFPFILPFAAAAFAPREP